VARAPCSRLGKNSEVRGSPELVHSVSDARGSPVAQMVKNPISNNVGGVKHVLKHTSACTQKKSAISLSKMVCAFPTWARFESSGSRTRSDPAISSITYCDHDYLFELPF